MTSESIEKDIQNYFIKNYICDDDKAIAVDLTNCVIYNDHFWLPKLALYIQNRYNICIDLYELTPINFSNVARIVKYILHKLNEPYLNEPYK